MGVTRANLLAAPEMIWCKGHRSSQVGVPCGPRMMAVLTILFVDGGDFTNVVEFDGQR